MGQLLTGKRTQRVRPGARRAVAVGGALVAAALVVYAAVSYRGRQTAKPLAGRAKRPGACRCKRSSPHRASPSDRRRHPMPRLRFQPQGRLTPHRRPRQCRRRSWLPMILSPAASTPAQRPRKAKRRTWRWLCPRLLLCPRNRFSPSHRRLLRRQRDPSQPSGGEHRSGYRGIPRDLTAARGAASGRARAAAVA